MIFLNPYLPLIEKRRFVSIKPMSSDPFFAGQGFLSGTILQQKRPAGGAIVQLIHTETNTVIRTTTSEVDGTFMFQNVAEDHEYHIVAIDPAGEWEHKVSSRRYPRTTL